MRARRLAFAIALVAGCGGGGAGAARPTAQRWASNAGAASAATSPTANASAVAPQVVPMRVFHVASQARMTESGEVAFLSDDHDLVAWSPDQNAVRLVRADMPRNVTIEDGAKQASLPLASGWAPRKGHTESDDRYARARPKGAPPVVLEGHRDSGQSVVPYAFVNASSTTALVYARRARRVGRTPRRARG